MSEGEIKELVEIHKRCDAFFKTQLDHALTRQQVSISEEAAVYLLAVMLLGFKIDPNRSTKSLAEEYLTAQREERSGVLKLVGDLSLIIAGIWWQSLARRLVDVDYYMALGQVSYKRVSEIEDSLSDLFEELSKNFSGLVDVLMDASQCVTDAATNNTDILRMYEVWQRTHNNILGARLRALGINVIPLGKAKLYIQ